MTKHTKSIKRDADDGLDDALDQSFPASDPPSHTNPSQGTKKDAEALREQAEKK